MTPRLNLALALLLPFIAASIQWLLWDAYIKPYVWFLFFPAAFFSAWLGGLKGGIAGGVIGALLVWYVYMPPQFSFVLESAASAASIVLFIIMAVLFGWVFERLWRAQALAHASYDATFEQAALGIALVAPDGRWLRVNRKLCEIVGYPPAELLTKPFQDITHPDDLDTDLVQVRRMQAKEIDTYAMEKRYIRKDGSLVWVSLTVSLVWQPDGKPSHFISVIEDISARKALEATLREREHRLSAIVGYSPSALSLKHPDGRYALVNPNLQRIHHMSEADIIGKTDADLYPEATAQIFRENDRRVLETLARHSIEEIVPVDGIPRTYMSHIFPVLDDEGNPEFICRISLDITERKAAERELTRRIEELERFDRAAVGRELQMIELKRQVNALVVELGRAPPYDLSFAGAPSGRTP